jgi:hypothetical protein
LSLTDIPFTAQTGKLHPAQIALCFTLWGSINPTGSLGSRYQFSGRMTIFTLIMWPWLLLALFQGRHSRLVQSTVFKKKQNKSWSFHLAVDYLSSSWPRQTADWNATHKVDPRKWNQIKKLDPVTRTQMHTAHLRSCNGF